MTLSAQIQHLFHQLKLRLGLVAPDQPDEIEELKKDPQKPPEYLERFSLTPLIEEAHLKGREGDLEILQRAYNNWKQVHRPFLLIGEPGCGLSSFVSCSLLGFENAKLLPDNHRIYDQKNLLKDLSKTLGLSGATSIDQFVEQALASDHQVVFFENVERIFLRTLGGFDLLEDLRMIINLTSERIFWILTINSYPLYYLDRTIGFRSFFENSFRYQLKSLDNPTVEAIIDSHNEGYQLIFLKAENIKASIERSLRKADSDKKQQLLRADFFEKLHNFSLGNISRALLFWIESIQGVRGEKVFLKPFASSLLKEINNQDKFTPVKISQQGLFALEAIFQHSSLSIDDLDLILRNSEQPSRLIIAQLRNNRWIHPRKFRNGHQEYQINLLYQAELKKLLINQFNRNIKID